MARIFGNSPRFLRQKRTVITKVPDGELTDETKAHEFLGIERPDSCLMATGVKMLKSVHYIISFYMDCLIYIYCKYMVWFKFILSLMFFELVSILFAIVPGYGNEYMTKENKY